MGKSKPFGTRKYSKPNTLGDFISQELKKQINDAVQKKDSNKQDKYKTTKDK